MLHAIKDVFHKLRKSSNPISMAIVSAKDFLWKIKNIKTILIKIHNKKIRRRLKANGDRYTAGNELWGYISFKKFLDSVNQKIKIAENIKKIRIDVGLSFCAPNSALWLEKDPDLLVFGFEPNTDNVYEILNQERRRSDKNYKYVDKKLINKRFFVFDVAIDSDLPGIKTFYKTEKDPGTSSLYEPTSFKIKEIEQVYTIRLSDFLDLIPWDKFGYIEQIKVDAQGNDLRILKSAGHYLSKKIVFVTAECSAKSQYSYSHLESELDEFMLKNDFEFIDGTAIGNNKTYINKKFIHLLSKLDYSTEGL